MLRAAGIRASARAEMQLWLTVAAAWLSPLRGAVVAAAQQGLALVAKEDLITVAARAVRERLHLARTAGLPLDAGTVPMLLMPESWTAGRVREIARALLVAPDLPSLPTSEEAVKVRERLEPLARSAGVRTPAADFLDGFAAEDAQACAPSAAREPVEAGESRRSARR
jgi:hypothetical protein